MADIYSLNESIDRKICGNKAASLAYLIKKGIDVPDGFVLSVNVFYEFFKSNGGRKEQIKMSYLTNEINRKKLVDIIDNGVWDEFLLKELKQQYSILGGPVCIRSSGNCEDGELTSMAGFYTSEINVRNFGELLLAIKECWKSAFSRGIIHAFEKHKIDVDDLAIALLVQKLSNSITSGVAVIDNDQTIICATYGLGQGVVSGNINSDEYVLDNKGKLCSSNIGQKEKCFLPFGYEPHGVLKRQKRLYYKWKNHKKQEFNFLSANSMFNVILAKCIEDPNCPMINEPALNMKELVELHALLKKVRDMLEIEKIDIEWNQDENGFFHILQARKFLGEESKKKVDNKSFDLFHGEVIGIPVSSGKCLGRLIKFNRKQDREKIKKGDIIVMNYIPEDFMDLLPDVGGIILKSNVLLSHCALIAREWRIPCIAGVNSDKLDDQERYILNGNTGIIKKLGMEYERGCQIDKY